MIFVDCLIFAITIPVILFTLQWYLCKKKSKHAIFLPIIVGCLYILLGLPVLGVSVIMLLIYIVMTYILNEKKKRTLEIEKMTIQDL